MSADPSMRSVVKACMESFFIRLAVGFGVVVLLAVVFFGPLLLWAGPHWPKVTEPAKVRHEAALLCQSGYDGPVPQEAWPEGIAALKPRMVVATSESVNVMISAGGISALPWGYVIWPDTVARTDGGFTKYDTAREKE